MQTQWKQGPPMNFTGRILNQKYLLLEPLAEGGMALIYKAQHLMLNDICAVKVIKDSNSSKEKMLQRFKREAQTTRLLAQRSPNIINIYDFGVEEGIGFFYVMELLHGHPLSALLKTPATPPALYRSCRIIMQACEALHVVHQHNLVHRDIKADNVFLHHVPNTNEEQVKLLDFGIVRPIYTEGSALTTYGRVMGTPEYMSPEQCKGPTQAQYQRGVSHLDGRSDIYSLGVLFYQCLTGRVPFPMQSGQNSVPQVMAGHVLHTPPSPSEKRPDLQIPKGISDVNMHALAKKPEARYQTMLEFRDAILANIPRY
ncbi:MAG: hypothetical protein CL920_14605 [Deltaproteobacteria bacterium]|nr:hypothetical protein [Deltaproteobacteria bacterium]MBU49915.1 hypothetical protein [Deltaproteobacteria bacterium]|tara:strand:+ start:1047 stop:1985 length:939 start_codon:yes stop_codon:yes gene_type:complete